MTITAGVSPIVGAVPVEPAGAKLLQHVQFAQQRRCAAIVRLCWQPPICTVQGLLVIRCMLFLGRLVHAVQFSKDAVHHHFVADSGDLLASCICTVNNVDALRIVSR